MLKLHLSPVCDGNHQNALRWLNEKKTRKILADLDWIFHMATGGECCKVQPDLISEKASCGVPRKSLWAISQKPKWNVAKGKRKVPKGIKEFLFFFSLWVKLLVFGSFFLISKVHRIGCAPVWSKMGFNSRNKRISNNHNPSCCAQESFSSSILWL